MQDGTVETKELGKQTEAWIAQTTKLLSDKVSEKASTYFKNTDISDIRLMHDGNGNPTPYGHFYMLVKYLMSLSDILKTS